MNLLKNNRSNLLLLMCFISLLFFNSCQKEKIVSEDTKSISDQNTDKNDYVINLEELGMPEKGDTLNISLTPDEDGMIKVSVQTGSEKTSSRGYHYFRSNQKIRFNYSKNELNGRTLNYSVSGINRYASGGCGAKYITKVPSRVYTHNYYWRYKKVRNASDGSTADSYYCSQLGAYYWYSSLRNKSGYLESRDFNGDIAGFTVDNNCWYGCGTECNISVYF